MFNLFKVQFCMQCKMWIKILLSMWTAANSSTICLKDYPFSTELPLHFDDKLIDHVRVGLLLNSVLVH